MILQALYEYYQRKGAHQESEEGGPETAERLAPPGFQVKEIPFVIRLKGDGAFIQLEDTREEVETGGKSKKKQKRSKSCLVPQEAKRSGKNAWQTANLLWDKPDYVLGFSADPAKQDVAQKAHEAFKKRIADLPESVRELPAVRAVRQFLDNFSLEEIQKDSRWPELEKATGALLTFQVGLNLKIVCEEPAVQAALATVLTGKEATDETPGESLNAICLVTGNADEIARLHPAIKGVPGSQTSGANIVSFNLDAFNSYGKSQGFNAPVGQRAAFAYTTALNHLLRKDSRQKIQLGETTVVFWAEKPVPDTLDWEENLAPLISGDDSERRESALENLFPSFGGPRADDPDRQTIGVKKLYDSPYTGKVPPGDDTRFYVLALAPNAARLAIRFWHVLPLRELATNIRRHFEDLEIVGLDRRNPPLVLLLKELAAQRDRKNIPPQLEGELLERILLGLPYPMTVLHALIRRIRAEHAGEYNPVNRYRAAMLKACLNRWRRQGEEEQPMNSTQSVKEKEITVGLDKENTNIGYRLGRLFAVLEKLQEDTHPGINATIRDRYYGSASSTPVVAFSRLMKLKIHHLGKLESPGMVIFYERLFSEVTGSLDHFPAQLSLFNQGTFHIGYYHQRQDFYKKKEQPNTLENNEPELLTTEA